VVSAFKNLNDVFKLSAGKNRSVAQEEPDKCAPNTSMPEGPSRRADVPGDALKITGSPSARSTSSSTVRSCLSSDTFPHLLRVAFSLNLCLSRTRASPNTLRHCECGVRWKGSGLFATSGHFSQQLSLKDKFVLHRARLLLDVFDGTFAAFSMRTFSLLSRRLCF